MNRSFFGRVGGKNKLLKEILPLLPKNYSKFIEPFVGAGSVFLNIPIIKERVINDLDTDIFNMWDDLQKMTIDEIDALEEIPEKIEITKEFFKKLLEMKTFKNKSSRFLRNYYISKLSFGANRRSLAVTSENRKSINKKKLLKIHNILKDVKITNIDYKICIKENDSPNSFFYLDPPYEKTQDYVHKDISKMDLVETLKSIKGKFLLSYNYSIENKELFEKEGFSVIVLNNVKYSRNNREKDSSKQNYSELLIKNY